MIPLVVANERGGWLNRMRVIPGRGCVCGVVGFMRAWSASCAPTVVVVSGKCVESPAVDGESPVDESVCVVVVVVPE